MSEHYRAIAESLDDRATSYDQSGESAKHTAKMLREAATCIRILYRKEDVRRSIDACWEKICLAYQGDTAPCPTPCLHCHRIAKALAKPVSDQPYQASFVGPVGPKHHEPPPGPTEIASQLVEEWHKECFLLRRMGDWQLGELQRRIATAMVEYGKAINADDGTAKPAMDEGAKFAQEDIARERRYRDGSDCNNTEPYSSITREPM